MSGPTHGARTGEVAQIAEVLDAYADDLERLNVDAAHAVRSMGAVWDGRDANDYVKDWEARGRPALSSVTAVVRSMAQSLRRHAGEQSAASSVDATSPGIGHQSVAQQGVPATTAAAAVLGAALGASLGSAATSGFAGAEPSPDDGDWDALIAEADVGQGGQVYSAEEIEAVYGDEIADQIDGLATDAVEKEVALEAGPVPQAPVYVDLPLESGGDIDIASHPQDGSTMIAEVVAAGHSDEAAAELAAAQAEAAEHGGEAIPVGTIGPDGEPLLNNPQYFANEELFFGTSGVVALGPEFPDLYVAYELTSAGIYEYVIYDASGALPPANAPYTDSGLTFGQQVNVSSTMLDPSRPTVENWQSIIETTDAVGSSQVESPR